MKSTNSVGMSIYRHMQSTNVFNALISLNFLFWQRDIDIILFNYVIKNIDFFATCSVSQYGSARWRKSNCWALYVRENESAVIRLQRKYQLVWVVC